jgi:hypothetical protein
MKRAILWGWLLFMPGVVQAARPLIPDERDQTLDFSLYFMSSKAPFDYSDGNTYDTTSHMIGAEFREKVAKHLMLGMHGGYTWVTQSGNPLTSGIELGGYHAGLSLYGTIFESKRASLYYVFDYTYQQADNNDNNQSVTIEWSEPQALLGASILAGKRMRLYGGGGYGRIDGEERANGDVNHTTDFSRSARALGFLGLDLNLGPNGYIGVEAGAGLNRSAQIYFKQNY